MSSRTIQLIMRFYGTARPGRDSGQWRSRPGTVARWRVVTDGAPSLGDRSRVGGRWPARGSAHFFFAADLTRLRKISVARKSRRRYRKDRVESPPVFGSVPRDGRPASPAGHRHFALEDAGNNGTDPTRSQGRRLSADRLRYGAGSFLTGSAAPPPGPVAGRGQGSLFHRPGAAGGRAAVGDACCPRDARVSAHRLRGDRAKRPKPRTTGHRPRPRTGKPAGGVLLGVHAG
jgi:hypothetical protein